MIHVYFGEGKGKTTAAIGLAVRAAGRGRRVIFAQFLKSRETGEITSLEKLGVRIIRSEKPDCFSWEMTEEQKDICRTMQNKLLETVKEAIFGAASPDLLVLDEVLNTNTEEHDLLDEEALREFIDMKPEPLEIVLTGRPAPEWLIEKADYVTEMKKHKHPYDCGTGARESIEY
jgi:cob(I)alamin adenosyltransferase